MCLILDPAHQYPFFFIPSTKQILQEYPGNEGHDSVASMLHNIETPNYVSFRNEAQSANTAYYKKTSTLKNVVILKQQKVG
jgi:hypothetical protein